MAVKYPLIDIKRRELDISKTKFSKMLGISRKTYYNWQKFGKIPSDKLILISNLLGCSIETLMKTGEQNEN